MSKTKTIPVLLTLAAAFVATACNPLQSSLDPLYPMSNMCADAGDGCPPPPPEHDPFKNP